MEVRVEDHGYDIDFAVKQSDGSTALDLTEVSSIKFQVVEIDSRRNIINGDCSIVGASEGTCKYTVQPNDFSKSGNFVGGLNLTYNSGKVITTKDIFITVKKKLT